MKKSNLFMVIGLTIIMGGSVLSTTANLLNSEPKTKITQKKKANENQQFTLNIENTNLSTADDNSTNLKTKTMKTEWQGQNTAMLFKGESITQTSYEDNLNDYNLYINNQPNAYTTLLNKWQITPYYPLLSTNETTKITIRMKLNYNEFYGGTNEQNNLNLKLKITTLTSLENWANYMGESNYYAQGRNNAIIENIKNPQNRQNYNESIKIDTITLTKTNPNQRYILEQELTIRKPQINQNTTNYIFTLIQPYTENLEYGNYISGGQVGTAGPYWAYIWNNETEPIKIEGTLIPPINNYEVVDIPTIMFTILTMPFSFISQAFNLTLFPGTPYQLNISNLVLTILAILIFVFIIRTFIKK